MTLPTGALPTPAEVREALPEGEAWAVLQGYRPGAYVLRLDGVPVAGLYTRNITGSLDLGWTAHIFGGVLRESREVDFRAALGTLVKEPT